jgi:hypothetical protein
MDPLADLEARGLVPDSTDREALRARIRAGQIGNPLADVITKVLYTYTIRILRQESSLRDHDAAARSQAALPGPARSKSMSATARPPRNTRLAGCTSLWLTRPVR